MKSTAGSWAALPGVPPLLSLLGLLLAWQVASQLAAIEGLPPVTRVLAALPGIVFQKETLFDVGASLERMALGFGLALLFAVPLGLVMGRSRAVAGFFNPLLTVIYPVPKAALMPVIMLWAGVGDTSKVLVIFLGVSLPLVYHSYQGSAVGLARSAAGLPRGPGNGADRDGQLGNDRAAIGRREPAVQFTRHGAVRSRLRDDHRDLCDWVRARLCVRKAA